MHESGRNGTPLSAKLSALNPCNGRAIAWARQPLLVGVRIRRVRRLGELVLQLRRDRRVEVQALRRDLLGKPFVVDLLTLAAGIECGGRGIDYLLEGRVILAQ